VEREVVILARIGRRLSALALLLLLVHSPALAQEAGGRRAFVTLGPDQGIPSGAPLCMTQDADGFVWVGTENGLVRYEGGQSRRWSAEDGLPSSWVTAVAAARGGGVWVATARGLVRFHDGTFGRPVALPAQRPPAITVARDGRLWVSVGGSLFRETGDLDFQLVSALPSGRMSSLNAGRTSGAVYLAGEWGVLAIAPDGSRREWGEPDGLPAGGPTMVAEDGLGRVWAGAGRTLAVKEQGGSRFVDRSAWLTGSLSPNSAPFTDDDGALWLPTQDGAVRVAGGEIEHVSAAEGLPFRWVRTVFRDREHTLWVIGPALARLQGAGRVRNYALSGGTSGEVVWCIGRDRQGRLLVGTDDGAARMGAAGLERIAGTEGHRVKAIVEDGEGTVWMAGTIGGALWLRAGRATAEPAPLGKAGVAVNSLFEDREGRVWIGHTTLGVLRWDPAARTAVQEVAPSFTNTAALAAHGFRQDAAGRLWVGSSAGMLVRGADGAWRLFTANDGLRPFPVRGLALLPDGSVWLHYQEAHGLTRVRLDGDRLVVLEQRTRGRGLRSNLVYAVDVDPQGGVWATTEQGLDRLDPPLHVGRHDGMVSEDCAIAALRVEDARVWAGTAGGLVRFDVPARGDERHPPQAHILEMQYGGRTFEPPIPAGPSIGHDEATVGFRIAAPAYANEGEVRFQVRLVGLEADWRVTDGRRVVYPALGGGRYQFEVRAAEGDGPFGSPSRVAFVVRDPWWQTWWALALYGLVATATVMTGMRWRVRALRRRQAELEALVAARTQELRTRNEELSAALGNVKQLSGLLPICANCKKIRDDSGYWSQIEGYISKHSEVDFSHGICPECMDLLYPEYKDQP
jgi:ligand-binding sensor domain-containing protein